MNQLSIKQLYFKFHFPTFCKGLEFFYFDFISANHTVFQAIL
jgi:hypothetical protein